MKKLSLIILTVLCLTSISYGQIKLGVRGGMNFNTIKIYENQGDYEVKYDNGMGFHFGLTSQLQISKLFLQPELIFSTVKNEVTLEDIQNNGFREIGEQRFNKFDIPIIAGLKFGKFKMGAGPVGTIMLNSKSELLDKYEMDQKSATWGYQLAAGFDFDDFNIELRYEGNFSNIGTGVRIANREFNFDQRSSQVILTAAYYF